MAAGSAQFNAIERWCRLTSGVRWATYSRAMVTFARAALAALLTVSVWAGPAYAEGVRLLAFGDSLTHGFGLLAADTFPRQLEDALRAKGLNVTVINGGNSGDTSGDGLARLDWAMADMPDAVILELGANDALRGLSPRALEANLAAILERLGEKYIPVLLTGMIAPCNLGETYTQAFDAVFPALSERFDVLLYPFFLDGVATIPSLNQVDGIHPNGAGVKVIVERILPYVVQLIDDDQTLREKARCLGGPPGGGRRAPAAAHGDRPLGRHGGPGRGGVRDRILRPARAGPARGRPARGWLPGLRAGL
jgi:acyl-CoA thioesterase-1